MLGLAEATSIAKVMEQARGLVGDRGRKPGSRAEAYHMGFFTHGENFKFYFDSTRKAILEIILKPYIGIILMLKFL